MTGLSETMFFIGIIIFIGIFLLKFYNIMRKAEMYGLEISFLLFVLSMIAYTFCLVIFMFNVISELVYLQLFNFMSWLVVFHIIFLFIEIVLNMRPFGRTIKQRYITERER